MGLSNDEIQRYARHLALPEIGRAGQERLRTARVLCVGAGGLGSPVVLYLAAAGVGRLGIVDADVVEVSNLQRQILHGVGDLGRAKTESAAAAVRRLNPEVEVVPHAFRLTPSNALDVVRPYEVAVDGSDNCATRYALSDACVRLAIPCAYAAVYRFEGQASLLAPHLGAPCYRCLFPEPPPPDPVAGPPGVLTGIVGCIQAAEVLKLLLGQGHSLLGRLLLVNALDMRFRELKVRRDPACPSCSSLK